MAINKAALSALLACTGLLVPALSSQAAQTAQAAPKFITTEAQKAIARQVAQQGVPISELAPNAPERYTIQRGATLWHISTLYLKSPWRWPELWGMNLEQIKNPHLIYPGQVLVLVRSEGRALLMLEEGSDLATVRVSPQKRIQALPDNALPTLKRSVIEPFLAAPLIVDAEEFAAAPRIVSAQEGRVLLSRGDRAYARGPSNEGGGSPLQTEAGKQTLLRVFRGATPLKDPESGQILGYEAVYAGRALLVSNETTQDETDAKGKTRSVIVPARIDILSAKEEIRVGDRLLPEPPREWSNYTPHAPQGPLDGRIVSVYGSAVENAAQNQVVAINKGQQDGINPGTVLAILKNAAHVVDKQDASRPMLKLPDERIGLLIVFRSFERVSYALVLDITDGVRVGDKLASPSGGLRVK
ncbi:MAG: LysM peptidoglycan-binding domain-containing protein [Rhodoferax sp.]|nr:LysM peptidoglycan-binding domain-containing protein [Rhodoferax sp.]